MGTEVTPIEAKGRLFHVGEDGVGVITLSRPERKNPLTFDIYRELTRLFAELEYDDRVRAVVLRGEGGAFC